jgi:hypothetical protein
MQSQIQCYMLELILPKGKFGTKLRQGPYAQTSEGYLLSFFRKKDKENRLLLAPTLITLLLVGGEAPLPWD